MRTCITGATGYIGNLLMRRLQQEDAPLRILSRRAIENKGNTEVFNADLVDQSSSLEGLFDHVDVIFHCAGEIKNPSLMHALHVGGTARLLAELSKSINAFQRPVHWVQLSSVGAYGSPAMAAPDGADADCVVSELSATAPKGEYEISKTMADELVIEFAESEPLFTYTIVRPSTVIGKSMPNQSVRALVRFIRKKLFFYVGSRQAVANYIHVEDVIDVLVACGFDQRAKGQIYIVSNDCLISDIVSAVALHYGVKPPDLCVPEKPLRLLVKFFSRIIRLPLSQERIDALVRRTRYSGQNVRKQLGLFPRHSIPQSIAEMFDE